MRAPDVASEVVLGSDSQHGSTLRLLHKLLRLEHGTLAPAVLQMSIDHDTTAIVTPQDT